jgi:hypothetical protein
MHQCASTATVVTRTRQKCYVIRTLHIWLKTKRVTKVKGKNALEHVVKADEGGGGENWGTCPIGSYRIGSWLGPRKQ